MSSIFDSFLWKTNGETVIAVENEVVCMIKESQSVNQVFYKAAHIAATNIEANKVDFAVDNLKDLNQVPPIKFTKLGHKCMFYNRKGKPD